VTPAIPTAKPVNSFPPGTPYVSFGGYHDELGDDWQIHGWLGWDGKQFIWEQLRTPPYPGHDEPAPYLSGKKGCFDPDTGLQVEPYADPVRFLECLVTNFGRGSRFRISELRIK